MQFSSSPVTDLILAAEPQPAHHHLSSTHAGDFLHHFARLLELFEEAIHILNRGPTAACDTRAPAPIDNQMIPAFLQVHLVDYRLDTSELKLGIFEIGSAPKLLDSRNHTHP